jgi:hypothetical protein
MHTNLYLVETLDRQRRQEFIAQATRTCTAAQKSNIKLTRSKTMKRMKLLATAVLVAASLLSAGLSALAAQHDTVPTVASMCCWRTPS